MEIVIQRRNNIIKRLSQNHELDHENNIIKNIMLSLMQTNVDMEEQFDYTRGAIKSRKSKDSQCNGQMKTQHKRTNNALQNTTENQRLRNTNPTKNQGRTQVLRKSREFLLLLWNQDDKSETFLCKSQDLILIDTCHSLLLFVFNDLRRDVAGRDVSMDEIVENSCLSFFLYGWLFFNLHVIETT